MRKLIMVIILISAFFTGTCSAKLSGPDLPAEIAAYYDDYNYVSSFSTVKERIALAGEYGESMKERMINDKRLSDIDKKIREINLSVFQFDSEIQYGKTTRRTISGFLELQKMELIAGNEILIKVVAENFSEKENLRLIDLYYKIDKENFFNYNTNLMKKNTYHYELHKWIKTGKGWKKMPDNMAFTED